MLYLSGKWHALFESDFRFGVMYNLWNYMYPPAGVLWALDNGCFTHPEAYSDAKMTKVLDKLSVARGDCLFVVAPDVVGDADQTYMRSINALPLIRSLGYPAAFVAQDGITPSLMPDWDWFDVLFIGGSTPFKLGMTAQRLIHEAKLQGKWVHMGRVNTLRRLRYAYHEGCDSADGTAVAYEPDGLASELTRYMGMLEL